MATNNDIFKWPEGVKPIQELIDFGTMRRSGSVELRPVHEYKHKDNHFSFRCYKGFTTPDKDRKVFIGIPVEVNPNGTYKFQKIEIRNHRLFTLANEQDAKEWHCVQHHFNVAGSLNASAVTNFKIFDANIEAEKEISKFNLSLKAGEIIRGMSISKKHSFGRLFSVDPLNNSDMVIEAKLLEVCMKNPQAIIDANRNTDFTNVKEVFYRALSFAEIRQDVQKGYVFRHQMLGYTVDAAVLELMKDMQLVHMLDTLSREKEAAALNKARKFDNIVAPVAPVLASPAPAADSATVAAAAAAANYQSAAAEPIEETVESQLGIPQGPPVVEQMPGAKNGKKKAVPAEQAIKNLVAGEKLNVNDNDF